MGGNSLLNERVAAAGLSDSEMRVYDEAFIRKDSRGGLEIVFRGQDKETGERFETVIRQTRWQAFMLMVRLGAGLWMSKLRRLIFRGLKQ